MTDDAASELEVSCDIDGDGPLPPIKFRLQMSDGFKQGYIIGTLVMTGIFLGLLQIV